VSKKLNQSNGVVHPRDVDPGIEKPAPKTGDPNVASPLGTSGGTAPGYDAYGNYIGRRLVNGC
jgi:hypothetical protein